MCVTGHSLSFALLLSLRAGVTLRRRRAAVQCVRTRSSTFAGQHACGPLSLRRTVNSQHRWSLLQYREFLGWSPKRGRLAHPIVCSNHWMARCQQVQSRSRLGRGCCSARARGREGGAARTFAIASSPSQCARPFSYMRGAARSWRCRGSAPAQRGTARQHVACMGLASARSPPRSTRAAKCDNTMVAPGPPGGRRPGSALDPAPSALWMGAVAARGACNGCRVAEKPCRKQLIGLRLRRLGLPDCNAGLPRPRRGLAAPGLRPRVRYDAAAAGATVQRLQSAARAAKQHDGSPYR